MKKIKDKIKNINFKSITIETFFCLYIILCPLLDVISFLFRQKYNTMISPSTILRPIIPIILAIYVFIKKGPERKKELVLIGSIYGIYAAVHLVVFNAFRTDCAYGNIIRELQYLVNYTFMILNLYMYVFIFDKSKIIKLKKSIIISSIIYIGLMYLAIFTGTSSSTYIEGIGFKGWFESGNSISAILTLILFVLLPMIKDKKYRYIIATIVAAIGIYLTTLIGTRVGLFGFFLVLFLYIIVEVVISLKNNKKINKKYIGIGIAIFVIAILGISILGSNTLKRRKLVATMEEDKIENQTHLTGDLTNIYQDIINDKLDSNYMSEAQKESIIDLNNFAEEKNIESTDLRMQQLIYNAALVKNQKNILTVFYGTGFMNNFRELVMEMEIPAFLFNFGIFGFVIYFIPFLAIAVYASYWFIKRFKNISVEYTMYLAGSWFTFALSLLSGYTFFNSSTMMIIIVIDTLLLNEVSKIKKSNK